MPNQTLPTYKKFKVPLTSDSGIYRLRLATWCVSHNSARLQSNRLFFVYHRMQCICSVHNIQCNAMASQDQHMCTRHTQHNEKWNYFVFINSYRLFFHSISVALRKYPVFISAYFSDAFFERSFIKSHHSFEIYDNKNIFCVENKSDIFLWPTTVLMFCMKKGNVLNYFSFSYLFDRQIINIENTLKFIFGKKGNLNKSRWELFSGL